MIPRSLLLLTFSLAVLPWHVVDSFSFALFEGTKKPKTTKQQSVTATPSIPTTKTTIDDDTTTTTRRILVDDDIELPDFDRLFDKIQHISPLARTVISNHNNQDAHPSAGETKKKGFDAIDDTGE